MFPFVIRLPLVQLHVLKCFKLLYGHGINLSVVVSSIVYLRTNFVRPGC